MTNLPMFTKKLYTSQIIIKGFLEGDKCLNDIRDFIGLKNSLEHTELLKPRKYYE